MGKILADLRSLLGTSSPAKRGSVAVAGEAFVSVVTPEGLREYRRAPGSFYKVGDEVLVQGEVLVGKVAPEINIPSYSV
jgi:flagellar basal body rod protein FlgG